MIDQISPVEARAELAARRRDAARGVAQGEGRWAGGDAFAEGRQLIDYTWSAASKAVPLGRSEAPPF